MGTKGDKINLILMRRWVNVIHDPITPTEGTGE